MCGGTNNVLKVQELRARGRSSVDRACVTSHAFECVCECVCVCV